MKIDQCPTGARHQISRRAALVSLASAGAVLLNSCQSAAPAPASPAPSAAGQPPAQTAAPAPKQAVTLHEWFDLPASMAKHIAAVGDRFHATNASITIKTSVVPTAEMSTKLSTSIAGGKPPDLAYIGPPSVFANLIQANQLEPIDKYDKTIGNLDWLAPIKKVATHNGHFYSLPVNSGDLGFYYNADLYEKAGLNPDKPPSTWAELVQAGEAITKTGPQAAGHYIAIKPISWSSSQVWSAYLWQAGGDWLNADETEAAFNSPAGVTALQFWVDLVHNDKITPLKPIDNIVMGTDFSTGQVGSMTLYPIWVIQAEKLKFKARTAPLPKDVASATALGMGHLIVPKGSTQKEQAWTYLSWLMQPANAIFWCAGLGNLPTRTSLTKEPSWQDHVKKHPLVAPFVNAQATARLYYLGPGAEQIYVAVAQALEAAVYQRQTPKQALDGAAAKANAILKKAKAG